MKVAAFLLQQLAEGIGRFYREDYFLNFPLKIMKNTLFHYLSKIAEIGRQNYFLDKIEKVS